MVEAARDRLRLTEDRVAAMAGGLRKVAALPDPVGEVTEGWVRPNGLRVTRVRVPLGVVGVIYENRPNVTSDAAGLCLKAGNAAFLRGSSSALESNRADRGTPAPRCGQGGAARGRRGSGGGHVARDGDRLHAVAGLDRLPDPPRRPGAHRLAHRARHRALRARRRRELSHLRRRRGRPGHGARARRSTPRPTASECATRWRRSWCTPAWRPSSSHGWQRLAQRRAWRSAPTSAGAPCVPGAVPALEERLRHRVPRPGGGRRGGRRRGRRHRAHRALQLGAHRGDRDLRRGDGRPFRGARSTRRRCW